MVCFCLCAHTGTNRDVTVAASAAGISWTHYQYGNGYCNVPCGQGQNTCRHDDPSNPTNKTCSPGDDCAFGACIT